MPEACCHYHSSDHSILRLTVLGAVKRSMSVLLFPNQLLDTREVIRQVHHARQSTVLAKSFLEKAYHALRDEVWNLHRDVRDEIPPFNSAFDLSERHAASKIQRVEVSSALLCISQLAQFIGHNEKKNQYSLDTNDGLLVGAGLGQLCAAAIACAATIVDLPDVAVEAVRLAFRTGSVVETFSIQGKRSEESGGAWSIVVPIASQNIQDELRNIQDDAKLPIAGRAFVTSISDSECTISGSPARLDWLRHHSDLLKSTHVRMLPSMGVWHSGDVYSDEQVREVIQSRSLALGRLSPPKRAIVSASTGEKSRANAALSLFTETIQDILKHPIQWSSIFKTVADNLSQPDITTVQLFGFEQCPMTEILKTFVESNTAKPVTVIALASLSSLPQPSEPECKVPSPAIAIVGMSGRFPGAPDVDQLWDLLVHGRNMHRKIPKDRFDVETHFDPEGKKNNSSHTPYGCFIEEPGLFDPRFFSMSPREATQTDPMHRLALVTAYEALEMSGFVLNATPSSQQDRVGTFYGQTSDDWREVNAAQNIETYFIPGGVRAFAPGRISYHFGFRGPSYSVDTACSSSLAAIQIACSALKSGECDTAVTGGVNILTAPDIFAGLSKGQFLSKTGSCKTWDSKADGYCRADGVGSIILKRLDDAVADKNNILGVILSTATNHSADAISITHPHAGNQAYLYQSVMHDAGISPLDVSYIEMHGTGTQAGDMTEIRSVSDVFAPEGSRGAGVDEALYIGAVKCNIGHGEAAAGVGALIKVLLMLQKSSIPRHIGIQHEINPGFPDLQSRNMRVPFDNIPWPSRNGMPRTAFLNNFSAAGGNTAMLIQERPAKSSTPLDEDPRTSLPFVVSAKSLSSLQRNIQQLVSHIAGTPHEAFSSLSYTLTSRRMHHNYRIGVTASNLDDLKSSLLQKADEGNFSPVPSAAPKVTFVFTGQGAYYFGLGQALLKHSKQFRSTILHLNEISTAQGFPSFLPAINEIEIEQPSSLVLQLALVCVQIALVQLWKSWGVKPSLVVGHSLGEYAALYAAGVLTMEDTVYLVGARAHLLETKCKENTHAMLAVKASAADIESAVGDLPFDIACLNSPNDTVLAGIIEEIDALSRTLKQEGIQCTLLNLPYAFHSAQVDPILSSFEELASEIMFRKPKIPVISPLLGEVVEVQGVFNASYLCQHARELVNFVEALETAKVRGHITEKTLFVEIGPHPICSRMVKSTFSPAVFTTATLVKGEDCWKSLSNAICSLHCAGIMVDFREFHREFESCHILLDLPSYSFDNKNYWIDYVNDWCLHKVEPRNAKAIEDVQLSPQSRLSTTSVHRITSEYYHDGKGNVTAQSDLTHPILRAAVQGHQVNNTSLFSSSIYADMALTLGDYVYRQMNPGNPASGVNCGDMEVFKPLIIKGVETETRVLEISVEADLNKGEAKVSYHTIDRVSKQSTLHATCVATFEDTTAWTTGWNNMAYLIEGRMETLKEKLARNQADKMSRTLLYRLFSSFVDYKLPYQGMEEVIIDGANFEATSRVVFQTQDKDGHFFCCPYWIDSLMHLAGFILNGGSAIDTKQFVYISHGWKALRFAVPLERTKTYHSYVKMQNSGESNIMAGDVYVFENNTIVAMCVGLKFQRVPRTVLNSFLPPQASATGTAIRPQLDTKSRNSTLVTSKALPDAGRFEKPKTNVIKLASSLTARVMDLISMESELPLSELQDGCAFASLGIDSLLSLQILGKLRETLDIDLPANVFIDYETVGDLKAYLDEISGDNDPSSVSTSPASTSTAATSPSILTDDEDNFSADVDAKLSVPLQASLQIVKGGSSGDDLLVLFRETISEQMGIAIEEVVGSNDLLSFGMDSLMSICILGIIREKTELDLPSDFFLTHNSVDDIARFLNPTPVENSKPVKEKPKGPRKTRTSTPRQISQPAAPLPRAVSILLQGKPRTATKTLFLLPDGSGSATSYVGIPAIDPYVAVYGLNSPYMKTPSQFTNGISGVATQYLEEIRRRQAKGPYHLGGWSAGGVVAYEITLQLLAAGERVESLFLLDSPCPIALEPLPSRLHHFFADIGLIGSDDESKVPDWLLSHFEASIKALTAYKPQPIPAKYSGQGPRTLAIWARHGVCRYPDSPRPEVRGDEPKSMNWLLNNRTDFGPNGWDKLLGNVVIETMNLDGNHFTLMKGKEELSELASAVGRFI
ncbi:putative polyketide synthase [Dothidotthia symphoricarpi CBS 119687]|uniref:Putative polyketide synthase n=1 Tax=Dothidotthia symphoricarpi CBS 119687 TaxID=1392245 RepID=A0A6A6AMQ0_9PLEO|nr:putative polyketide synthase [Dothidotthia symphoricarpi CBS 119687]KAF2132453.1 putative polyketide synthase [Dothidotthia symphoricarpi CBS 119687]